MFARQAKENPSSDDSSAWLLVLRKQGLELSVEQQEKLSMTLPEGRHSHVQSLSGFKARKQLNCQFLLSLFVDPEDLDDMADAVLAARESSPGVTLIIAVQGRQLLALGRWLDKRAKAGSLAGIRLMLENDVEAVIENLPSRLQPVLEDNVIRMPMSTEVENTNFRNFYIFSPELHQLVARIRGFALNGVTRAYLLGGPGSGKTSLAYYYFLARNKGRFISVNLAAENTGDKAAVKSLLCGHVTGAFPGAGARSGAFLLADDGTCFIDESHGVIGPVMEVLMEALDNNQYLPLGAAAKQPLRCAIMFATNRSWEHLQESVNLDEFTRIGAATLEVPELHKREEDMIAVIASSLARLAAPCQTWTPPIGLSAYAWEQMRGSRWHGNARAVIRVMEAAFVDTASAGLDNLIQGDVIQRSMKLWEPESHHSHEMYSAL